MKNNEAKASKVLPKDDGATAAPSAASIEGLTRYGLRASPEGFDYIDIRADGRYLLATDVQSLLATQSAKQGARPTDDELWDATLRDRDAYYEWADKLAEAISKYFDAYIGEHSNTNLPWAEALEAIESAAPFQTMDDTTRDAVLEEAAERLDLLNDSSGDAAAYDQRDMYQWEVDREQAVANCANVIRGMKSKRAASTDGEGADHE